MHRRLILSISFLTLVFSGFSQNGRELISFNSNWQFCNQEDFTTLQNALPNDEIFSFAGWQTVTLPHTAKVEPLVVVEPWAGFSWYKKDFTPSSEWKDKKVFVVFEAAMQRAEVWLNGKHLLTHYGGYLPFTIDISKELIFGKTNRLVVKTDNHDNPEVPPGKPIMDLDFCYFSGLYRNVSLIITNQLHITDAVQENKTASGGIRVWYPEVSAQSAEAVVSTHVRNESNQMEEFFVTCIMADKSGKNIAASKSGKITLDAGSDTDILLNLKISSPSLWHPAHPELYTLQVSLSQNGVVVDEFSIKTGIRKFELKSGKLFINDEPLLLTGTNRHQEYPYIGNALSDNAQYRDAVKIKEAGFNIVRLSHYPQSPAFMNACDELGLLTINAIAGWQFNGNEQFQLRCYQDARDLIRRDRNHASVVFWELSLNESTMEDDFMQQMNRIAREESPESKLITCGWIDRHYDVYIPARQHAKRPDYWKKYDGIIPLFTGEYGDWEYFAQDAGLNQAGYAGLKSDERTSRQLRGDGEKRLLQQAFNFQEAHNDNLNNPHLGDANWLMFDYNRGYSPDIESSGIMDIFRLPKFAHDFYRSQSLPTLKIASYWNEKSDFKRIRVYTDCEEVALYLNDQLIEKKKVAIDEVSVNLPHPPFVFDVKRFEPGELKAIGYIGKKAVAEDVVVTAGKPSVIKLSYDISGKPLKADGSDVVFVYATICDSGGNPVFESDAPIYFSTKGNGKLIGQNPVSAEAGIATILLQASDIAGEITIEAKSEELIPAKINLKTIQ